jgi:hypothetical protein
MRKLKNYFGLLLMMMFVGIARVNAITCAGVEIDNKIPNTVHKIILLIQIAVPILLVIFGMMDMMKGIMAQKDDEIKKGQQTFVKRLLAAVLVFFVVSIVKLVVNFVADNDDDITSCMNYFLNGIDAMKAEQAKERYEQTIEQYEQYQQNQQNEQAREQNVIEQFKIYLVSNKQETL